MSTADSFTEDPIAPMSVQDYVDKLTASLNDNQKILFNSFLNSQTLDGRSLKSLLTAVDTDTQAKVKRAIRQIIKSIYEASILEFDNQGGISDVTSFGASNFMYFGISKSVSSMEELVRARLNVNLNEKTYAGSLSPMAKPEDIDVSKIQIKDVDQKEAQALDGAAEIQKAIVQTQSSLVWFDRGKMIYDPVKKCLNSRGKSLPLDVKNLTIS